MNRRIEQRFQVYSPAKVILLDDPERELVCFLTDISAAGLRFLTDESLAPDGMIVVEAEDHLVLCDVRNCEARGSRFAVGAEKIHMLSKLELPAEMPAVAKIEALINDFHLRLRTELVSSKPALVLPEEPVLEAVEQPPAAEPVMPAAIENAPPPSLRFLSTEALPPIPPLGSPVLPRPPLPALGQFAMMLRPPVAPQVREIQPSPVMKAPVAAAVSLPPAVIEPIVRTPLPERIPVTADQRRVLRTWSIVVGVVAGLLMLVSEAVFHGPLRASAQMFPVDTRNALENKTEENKTEDKSTGVPEPPAVAQEVTRSIPVAASSRHATVTATDTSWVSACSDGKMVLARLMAPNETREIQFSSNALLRFGNAGGVQVSVDGKSIGPVGDRGMIRALELTGDGFSFLPPETGASSCRIAASVVLK